MSFTEEVLKQLNNFRKRPYTFITTLDNLKQNTKVPESIKNKDLNKEIDNFIQVLDKTKPLPALENSPALEKLAQKQLENLSTSRSIVKVIEDQELTKYASKYIGGFQTINILINDVTNINDTLTQLMFCKEDTHKRNRHALIDPTLSFVGIANKEIKGENIVIVILADVVYVRNTKSLSEHRPKIAFNDRSKYNNDELKQAFDEFDVYKTGRLHIKEIIDNLNNLGYDKNDALFSLLYEIDTKEYERIGVDWEDFSAHFVTSLNNISTRNGLKRIYDIVIDDRLGDTITLSTLKRLCSELGENVTEEQLKDMIQRASTNGEEITFDEFYDYMINRN
jgi:centrin-1